MNLTETAAGRLWQARSRYAGDLVDVLRAVRSEGITIRDEDLLRLELELVELSLRQAALVGSLWEDVWRGTLLHENVDRTAWRTRALEMMESTLGFLDSVRPIAVELITKLAPSPQAAEPLIQLDHARSELVVRKEEAESNWPFAGGEILTPDAPPREFRCEVYLTPDPEGGYSASVPTLPGCHSHGDTEEEALASIAEALEGCLETYKAEGLPVPWRKATGAPHGVLSRTVAVHV